MVKRLLLCLVLLLTTVSAPPSRAVLPVIDAGNLLQSIARYLILGKQLAQQVQQYQMLLAQYKDQIENLKGLDPRGMVLGYLIGRDLRRGSSFLANAQYLDPDHPMWRKDIESLLRQHYDFLDTDHARQIIDSAFPGGGEIYHRYYERRDREMTAVLDAFNFQATQHEAAKARQRQLENLKQDFLNLGGRTALRQAQATNGMLSVVAQQNEAIIDALQLSMTQQARAEIARRAVVERAIERDALLAESVRNSPPYECPTSPCFVAW